MSMLMLQSLGRRAVRLLARSRGARVMVLVGMVGLVVAAMLQTPAPEASAGQASRAVVPHAAASGRCTETPDADRWAGMARRGELDALAALADGGQGGANDAQAYKWLAAAADFGHARAEAMMKSLLEITALRYDDDGLLVGLMHHELGLAYLGGCEGLPNNLRLARQHLMWGREGVLGTERDLAADRVGLPEAAQKVFDEAFPPETLAPPPSAAPAGGSASAPAAAPLEKRLGVVAP